MARPPTFATEPLRDLLAQLRYAPPETRFRQMEAAEALLWELDPQTRYPADYIVFRITSFRSEEGSEVVLPGSDVIADLVKFIERLSATLELTGREGPAPRTPLTREQAAQRLGVSATTLHRLRAEGLPAHSVLWPDGAARVSIFEDALNRFAESRRDRIHRAARFRRLSPHQRSEVVRRARRFRRWAALSLHETAVRLAPRYGMTVEGVRRILIAWDQRHPDRPIFEETGPLTEKQQGAIHRAWRRGLPVRRLTDRYARSRNTIYRVINESRLAALRRLPIHAVALPTFNLPDAEEVLLSPAIVRADLPCVEPIGGDAVTWFTTAGNAPEPSAAEEDAVIAGLHFLRCAASQRLTTIDPRRPAAGLLDDIETRLRWATRLKRRLILGRLPQALLAAEQHLGGSILEQPPAELLRLHRLIIDALSLAVERLDPLRPQQRYASLVVFGLRRELARLLPDAPARTAARARRVEGSTVLPDLTGALDWWQPALEPPRTLLLRAAHIEADLADVLTLRFGLAGQPPQTLEAVAAHLRLTPPQAAARERRALRALYRRQPAE